MGPPLGLCALVAPWSRSGGQHRRPTSSGGPGVRLRAPAHAGAGPAPVGPRSGGRASPLPVARPFRSWPPCWWSGPFQLRSLSGPACLPGGLAVVGRFAPGF